MDADLDDDFVASITPDVMKCLDRSLFFEKLDDVLCPKDCSEVRQGCGSDYKLSESILLASGFDASDLVDIFDVLRGQGGFCDCEILYNVAESSRLKAEYWRDQAHGQDGQARHRPRISSGVK